MVYWIIRSGCENLTFFQLLWMEYSLTRSTYMWFEDFEKLHYVTLTMNVTLSPVDQYKYYTMWYQIYL